MIPASRSASLGPYPEDRVREVFLEALGRDLYGAPMID